jgi:Tol biopolymer transport system component
MRMRPGAIGLMVLGLGGAVAVPAAGAPADDLVRLDRVTVGADGAPTNGHSQHPVISADGRFVAFDSEASNLVAGDSNDTYDIFVFDRVTRVTEMVSVSGDGTYANDLSADPAISADGRFVSFTSMASNLVADDTNDTFDIFVHDRVAGTTERVSVGAGGEQSDRTSSTSSMSADGSRVAFTSAASNLVEDDDNGSSDVFVHDRTAGATVMASANSDGEPSNLLGAGAGKISPDGRFVVFRSMGLNYGGPGSDLNVDADVFVKDLDTGHVERVSVATDGTPAQDLSACPAVSRDAAAVVFPSRAANLVPADFNGLEDYFVRDRASGTTERINVTSAAAESVGVSVYMCPVSITDDARYVAFEAVAGDLVADDTNNNLDVFVHDRATGETDRISLSVDGRESAGSSHNPDITPDGRFVAFQGAGDDLVPGDTNGEGDIFVYDRGPEMGVGALSVEAGPAAVTVSGWASFAGVVLGDERAAVNASLRRTGADLTRVVLAQRPATDELSVTWYVSELPSVPGSTLPQSGQPVTRGVAAAPGVLYGLRLVADDRTLVLAGGRTAETALVDFAVYECELTCAKVADAAGSLGVTGVEARAVLSVAALGDVSELADVQAFTAAGTPSLAAPASAWLDRIALGPVSLTTPTVLVGTAGALVPGDEVDVSPVPLDGWAFTATLPSTGPGSGERRAWARACYAGSCTAQWRPYQIE